MFRIIVVYTIAFYLAMVFFQAEDGIRDLVRSRGLGDVYKRQRQSSLNASAAISVGIRAPSSRRSGSMAPPKNLDLSLIHI